jgi:GGDEF domain-containing protein
MTIAPNHTPLAAAPTAADGAVADVTSLLPTREAVLARLTEQLPTTGVTPATLLVVGLLRRDDGRPIAQSALAQVTTLLARSLRGDDWLGSSGPAEFVIVMAGPAVGARVVADRLAAAVVGLGVPGLSAAAGLATLTPELTSGEALRRATVSLTAARRVGPGTVVQHRLPY